MRRKIEMDEAKRAQQQQKEHEDTIKVQQEVIAAEEQRHQSELALRDLINQRDNDTKLIVAGMSQDGIVDPSSDESFDYEKDRQERLLKIQKLQDDMKKHKDNLKFNYDKLKKDSELKEKAIKVSKIKKTSNT